MIVVDSSIQVPLDGADDCLVTSSIARAPNLSGDIPGSFRASHPAVLNSAVAAPRVFRGPQYEG